jgi:hypothetical protein
MRLIAISLVKPCADNEIAGCTGFEERWFTTARIPLPGKENIANGSVSHAHIDDTIR